MDCWQLLKQQLLVIWFVIIFREQFDYFIFRQRQQQYLENSQQVTKEMVDEWSFSIRLWNNTLATLGPIL